MVCLLNLGVEEFALMYIKKKCVGSLQELD